MKRSVCAALLASAVVVVLAGCGISNDPQRLIAKAQEYRQSSNYKAAAIELKSLLQKTPDHAEARYLLGVTHMDSHEYEPAERELRRALDLSYERTKVLPALGKAMLMLGSFQKVLDQVPAAGYASNPVQADILTLRARALMGLGRNEPARELLALALVKQPEFADALVELTRFAASERKLDEAGRIIDRAIVSAPKHPGAWLLKGDLARVQGNPEAAMTAYRKVAEFDPANIDARLNIVSYHVANKKLDDARKAIAEIRKFAPGNALTYHMQALVDFQAHDFKAANDAIQQVLKVLPDYMPSVLLAGAILTELGSYEQAQQHIGRVLDAVPDNRYARKLLVLSLARSGQMQRAIEVLQPALKQGQDDNELMVLAGELYAQNRDHAKAAEYFEIAAKGDPKNAVTRTKLGINRMVSGDSGRAFADLETALELNPGRFQTDMLLVMSHVRRGSFEQAAKAMESLEKKLPNDPATFNLKAAIALGKNDAQGARKNFERAIELQPKFGAAVMNLAELDIQEKKPAQARSRLESFLEKNKDNIPVLLTLVRTSASTGATQKEQQQWLERAVKAGPKAVEPHVMLVRLHMQGGDTKKALETAQQAQLNSPENPQFLELLGGVQMTAGQYEPALATYRKLAQVQPSSAKVLYQLAGAQAGMADHAGAAASLKKALSIQPSYYEATVSLILLELNAKRYAEATALAREVQKQNPKSSLGLLLEGDVLLAQAKYPQAITAVEAAHALGKSSGTLTKLHAALLAGGRSADAEARLAAWLKVSPDDPEVRLYAAESAVKAGRGKDAIPHYEWMLQKQPDNVATLNNLALAYLQANDTRAVEVAERANKLAPNNPSVADTFGWVLIEQGNVARGMETLEKAAKAAPNSPEIRYHLAQGWIKTGDKQKAREQLNLALAAKVAFTQRADAQSLLKQLGN
jgi:putative PEP-CTERM system TPR-repeat lipoprotein